MLSLNHVLDCAGRTFKFKLGDLDPVNLTLFAGYLLATFLAFMVFCKRPFPAKSYRRETMLWSLAAFALLLLSLNKELDLQGWLSATGRCAAKLEGWYGDRRQIQAQFIRFLLIGTIVLALILLLALRGTLSRNSLPFLGFLFLFAFIGLRAISFHHLNHFLATEVASIRLHRWLEGLGLALIIGGEAMILASTRRKPAEGA